MPPFYFPTSRWFFRWLVTPDGQRLHRVTAIDADRLESHRCAEGRTACGLETSLSVPGMFSRMGLARCAHCCRAVGIERGDGAPYNAHVVEYQGDRAVEEWVEEAKEKP